MSVGNELQVLKIPSDNFGSPRIRPETSNTHISSNMNSSNNEDDNLLKTRRDIGMSLTSPQGETNLFIGSSIPTAKPSHFKKKVSGIMSSKIVEINVIILIVIYMLTVLVNILLDGESFNSSDNEAIDRAVQKLKYLELAILCIFTLEILLKVWAFGVQSYFKDCWYIIDATILVATFALVIVDIELNETEFSGISKIRVLFRLFRIFMLMRKANRFSLITKSRIRASGDTFRSPVEKILELLESLKHSIRDHALAKEIDWAIQIISDNKLYEPLIEPSDEKTVEKAADANLWLKAYANPRAFNRQESQTKVQDFSEKISILIPNNNKKDACNLLVAPISQQAIDTLERNADSLAFDAFAFKNLISENELVYLACYLFQKRNLFQNLNINQFTFTKFIKKIQSGYLPNLFHNPTHAADVLQTTNYFLTTGEFAVKADLSNLDIAAMFISAAIHDYEHPGTNNSFHINVGSVFAIRYNDKGVLENHHVSAVFALLKDDSLNIFNSFSKEDFKIIRERIISIVLATDMSTHFIDIGKLKGRLAADFDMKTKDKNLMMELLVHASDISNPTKNWNISFEWTTRVINEFFDQGDQERSLDLPITHLCDRYTINMAKSQIGFIDFVVTPLFSLLKEILPKLDISNLDINKNNWKDRIDHYDQELMKLNEKRDKKKVSN